ncbi:ImmA/IrrE family metallo-endopeptidase [Larkinella punicea]|uniref:ImmA/IrrE family metallo-endopeptidase n=1 Tax=Larkinella punicea TaxID=2315727 RepID=A0A368JJ10_9BACT|nr:ImmA/IrrE family metallo-endopeptidase [Larkinella punicea]RCR67522.1 ImmA/IrrE family metallo-endopeptidase [Larkinella punicea]
MNLNTKAILKADEIRTRLGLNIFQPINIFDACVNLGLTVRFVDINMEGLYVKQKNGAYPTIILSNQRPFSRRCFTCAHELGHHVFDHGLKIDTLSEQQANSTYKDSEEQLVDLFAGAMLLPIAGIQSEFAKRNWSIQKSSPVEYYTISSIFGVGYQTLIVHCKAHGLINEQKSVSLLKSQPAKILESLLETRIILKSHFKIIDTNWGLSIVDLEVTNYIILPSGFKVEGNHLQEFKLANNTRSVFIAEKPGIVRAFSHDNSICFFIRIQKLGYVGLAEYRHIEEDTE